jgi:hypothetical protein
VLRTKKHAPTFFPFTIFTFRFAIESIRSLGVHKTTRPQKWNNLVGGFN